MATLMYRQTNCLLREPYRLLGEPPGLFIAVLGRLTSLGGFSLHSMPRRFALHFIEDGKGTFEFDGRPHDVGPGDLAVLFPDMYVRYYDHPGRPWRYTWIGLRGERARWALSLAGLSEESPCLHGVGDDVLEGIFSEIESAYRSDSYPPLFPVTAAWRMVEHLSRDKPLPRETKGHTHMAEVIRRMVEQEFTESITIDEIARRLGVTRTTIFRHFRQAYGQSPKQYLDELRLMFARDLLRRTRSSVKEVARTSGFQSAHYFSRAFRRRFGLSPVQWKTGMEGRAGNGRLRAAVTP